MRYLRFVSSALLLVACGPSTPLTPDAGRPTFDAGPIDPTWASIYDRVIAENCAQEFCHLPSDPAGALDMSTADLAYTSLVGVEAMGDHCAGMGIRIVPGDPDNSLVVHKIEGSAEPDGTPLCGDRMPYLRDPLPDQWIAQIRVWIAAGAPRQ